MTTPLAQHLATHNTAAEIAAMAYPQWTAEEMARFAEMSGEEQDAAVREAMRKAGRDIDGGDEK